MEIDELLERAPLLSAHHDRVVIGCSGGPDSIGLLALAAHAQRDAVAVYVDHGLRSDSASDFDVVRSAADRFGMPAVMVSLELDPGSSNLEARARDARLQVLEEQRAVAAAASIWLAHSVDDQAETVLLAMMRGSGLAGMAGMAAHRGRIERPVLALRRWELAATCVAQGLQVVDDPMNHDLRFNRVWVRRHLMPMLNEHAQRDMPIVLARQAQIVRGDHEYLERAAAAVLAEAGSALSVELMRSIDGVIARRVVRQFLGEPPIGGKHIEAALSVVYGTAKAVELPNRRTLRRSGGILFVEPTQRVTE